MNDVLKGIPGVPDGYREELKPILTEEEKAHIQKLRDEGKMPPLNNRLKATPSSNPKEGRKTLNEMLKKG